MVSKPGSVSSASSSQPSVNSSSFSENISILPDGVSSLFATGSSRNFFMDTTGACSSMYTPISTASSQVGSFGLFSRAFSYCSLMRSSSVLPSVNSSATPNFSAMSVAIS